MSQTMAVRPDMSIGAGITRVSIGRTRTTTRTAHLVLVPQSQAYFWSPQWQQFEANATRDLHDGDVHEFDSADDAIAWLLAD